ncbi:hypothetical protein ACFXG4_27295 [Nocardia sp. NPDC059246]|uniref:hypothetical protein n=1 Tax=unclassified Nocardia TaxID=2637762 RepID=UPI00369D500F
MWVVIFGVCTAIAANDAVTHHVPADWVWATFWGILTLLELINYIRRNPKAGDR